VSCNTKPRDVCAQIHVIKASISEHSSFARHGPDNILIMT